MGRLWPPEKIGNTDNLEKMSEFNPIIKVGQSLISDYEKQMVGKYMNVDGTKVIELPEMCKRGQPVKLGGNIYVPNISRAALLIFGIEKGSVVALELLRKRLYQRIESNRR